MHVAVNASVRVRVIEATCHGVPGLAIGAILATLTGSRYRSLIRRMVQHQHDIDELARMERTCRDLAGQAIMPEERAGLLDLAELSG